MHVLALFLMSSLTTQPPANGGAHWLAGVVGEGRRGVRGRQLQGTAPTSNVFFKRSTNVQAEDLGCVGHTYERGSDRLAKPLVGGKEDRGGLCSGVRGHGRHGRPRPDRRGEAGRRRWGRVQRPS